MRLTKTFNLFSAAAFLCALINTVTFAGDNISAPVKYPQRIISLCPSVTEELYLLGAGNRVVGVTNYCTRPPEAREKEKVGAVVEVNVEKITGLKPDLVIASNLADLKAVEKMRQLRIRVITIPQAEDFTQLCGQFVELGEEIGKKEEAELIVRQAVDKVYFVKKKTESLSPERIFIQVGTKPLVTAKSGSLLNNLIELAGGTNIVTSGPDMPYILYSREKVLQGDPDCIIVVTMGIMGDKEKRVWENFTNLKAVKNKRVSMVDSYDVCSLTPATFAQELEKMAGIIHPELKVL